MRPGMHARQPQPSRTGVDEAMRRAGRDEGDLAELCFDRLLAGSESCLTLVQDKDLLVWVPVQSRPLPRLEVNHQNAKASAMLLAHEPEMRRAPAPELLPVNQAGHSVLPHSAHCGVPSER